MGWRDLRFVVLGTMFCGFSFWGPGATAQQTIGSIERLEPEFDKLVTAETKIEVIARGFTWTEGPVWIGGADGHLLFTDIPRNSIFKYQPAAESGREISLFMHPSGYTGVAFYGYEPGSNGLFVDKQGRLCMCEHGDRRVSALTPGGGKIDRKSVV